MSTLEPSLIQMGKHTTDCLALPCAGEHVADLCWCQIDLVDDSVALSCGMHANVLLSAYVAHWSSRPRRCL